MKRRSLLIIGLCFLCSMVNLTAHEFYVSVSSVKFIAEEKRLLIKIRMFTNDLEDAIVNRGVDRPDLEKDSEKENSTALISDYVTDHFSLTLNDEPAAIEFLERYDDADVTWSILQIADVSAVQKIDIENKILMEILDAQTNIVRFDVNGEKKFLNLTKKLPQGEVRFGG